MSQTRGDHRSSANDLRRSSGSEGLDLSAYPDVVAAVHSLTGLTAHFVPAPVACLPCVRKNELQLCCAAWSRAGLVSLDVDPPVFMVPLADTAVEFLRRAHLSKETDLAAPTAKALSSFALLPDHATGRGSTQRLRHTYFLMGDENVHASELGRDPATVSVRRPCLYLVQAWPLSNAPTADCPTRGNDDWLRAIVDKHHCLHLKSGTLVGNTGGEGNGVQNHAEAPSSKRPVNTCVTKSDANAGEASPKTRRIVRSGDWDPAILSALCRWRSCLCESYRARSDKAGDSILCTYHNDLRVFLDRKPTKQSGAGSGSESAKYLPRKSPNVQLLGDGECSPMASSKRDALVIRAASSLLQELWDGKLGQTTSSFARKMLHNMGVRVFLASSIRLFVGSHSQHYVVRKAAADGAEVNGKF